MRAMSVGVPAVRYFQRTVPVARSNAYTWPILPEAQLLSVPMKTSWSVIRGLPWKLVWFPSW